MQHKHAAEKLKKGEMRDGQSSGLSRAGPGCWLDGRRDPLLDEGRLTPRGQKAAGVHGTAMAHGLPWAVSVSDGE